MRIGTWQIRSKGQKEIETRVLNVLKILTDLNQIRALVLASLSLQIILAIYGSHRPRKKSRFLYFILWSAYLMADSVAISALSLLAADDFQPYENIGGSNKLPNLVPFWSPFLLLHLGGPDAMTALSLEDNTLWWRHFLGLIVHTTMTGFILIRSFFITYYPHPSGPRLFALSILLFLAGFSKYLERTLSLMSANFPQRRYTDAVFTDRSIQDYQSQVAQYWPSNLPLEEQRYKIVFDAHYLLQIFKRVFVNLSIDQQSHNIGKYLLRDKDWKEVFKVIEIELHVMFELLFTKALTHRAANRFTLKIVTFCLIFTVLIVFLFGVQDYIGSAHHQRNIRTDVAITHILLVGALVLEIYQGVLLLFSDWTIIVLKKQKNFNILSGIVLKFVSSSRLDLLHEQPRWSNSMGQCNLVSICLHSKKVKKQIKKLSIFIRMKRLLWIRDMMEKFLTVTVTHKPIDSELKEVILKHVWERVSNWEAEVRRIKKFVQMGISKEDLFRRFLNRWGEWVLEKHSCHKKYDWTIKLDIDHSILVWHIATDICYYQHSGSGSGSWSAGSGFGFGSRSSASTSSYNQCTINCSLSKGLSDYLMYLLLKHPTIVTSESIPDKRFNEACEALREVLSRRIIKNQSQACAKLLYGNRGDDDDDDDDDLREEIDKYELKQEPAKLSVIWAASILAKRLMNETPEERWEIIMDMWLEMLVYVANQCPGDGHAAELPKGGELITHVWLLMTHLGISSPCEPATTIENEEEGGWISGLWSWYRREFC